MKAMFGLLGLFIAAVIGFMYKTNQLESLKKGNIPGLQGKTFADLDPRKIVDSYKNTVGSVDSRNKALLSGEISEDALKQLAHASSENAKAANAINAEALGTAANPEGITPAASKAPSSTNARPAKIFRYGMELERLGPAGSNGYFGKWFYQTPAPQSYSVRLNLQPDRAISSAAVHIAPTTNMSRGDNYSMLWKNTGTGAVIVALNDHEYIALEGEGLKIKGTLFKRGADGQSFQRILDFPLVRP